MSVKRDYWVLPLLRARQVPAFLTALAPHLALASEHGLLLEFGRTGNLLALYPRASSGDPKPLHGRLGECLEACGRRASEFSSTPCQTRESGAALELTEGLIAWIARQIAPSVSSEEPRQIRVLIPDMEVKIRARFEAEVARRGRDARLLACEEQITLIDLDAGTDRGATIEGLRALAPDLPIHLLGCDILGEIALWLPLGSEIQPEMRLTLSGLLNGMREAGLLPGGTALHILPSEAGAQVWRWRPPTPEAEIEAAMIPAEVVAQSQSFATEASELGPPLRFQLSEITASEAAQQALAERINRRDFPVGYRIRLSPVGEVSRQEEDIERLRSEIEEREARIALIQALGRSQIRLLRFTDAQLPAMVDGLRRMPRALRENTGLRYAAAHAAGRAEPIHMLCYDPETVQLDGVVPEAYWRAMTEDSPMSFWLDPHAEDARELDPSAPHVFVPAGSRILPYIDSFGSSLRGTLALIMGGLFGDASAVLDAPGAEPAFLFAPATAGRDEITVDLIDLRSFQPLKLSLRWINEHILARSPVIPDPDDRRELAETLYAGELAQRLRAEARLSVEELKADWEQAKIEISAGYAALDEAAAAEANALAQGLRDAQAFVALAHRRLEELQVALNGLGASLGAIEGDFEPLLRDLPRVPAQRIAVLDRYMTEYEAHIQFLSATETEMTRLRQRTEQLSRAWART